MSNVTYCALHCRETGRIETFGPETAVNLAHSEHLLNTAIRSDHNATMNASEVLEPSHIHPTKRDDWRNVSASGASHSMVMEPGAKPLEIAASNRVALQMGPTLLSFIYRFLTTNGIPHQVRITQHLTFLQMMARQRSLHINQTTMHLSNPSQLTIQWRTPIRNQAL